MTIESLYELRQGKPCDINEHMPELAELARGCDKVVEFGVRDGVSTTAFLYGLWRGVVDACGDSPPLDSTCALHSYDIKPTEFTPGEVSGVSWHFTQQDTSDLLFQIPYCDGLFIDTLHTHAQVQAELRHARRVQRWIALHDTVLFGFREETTGDPPGINQAIFEFLRDHHNEWKIAAHRTNNCGLMILERC